MVNAPLAATAVSVVAPQRAGMASGINNTFRQVGIATGIAALGAVFQSRIASSLGNFTTSGISYPTPQGVASGYVQFGHSEQTVVAHTAFIAGLNSILLVAAIVLFAGAVLAFLLVREKDFVASGPAAAGH
jgi:hypothetical protein